MSASNHRRLDVDQSISAVLPVPMVFRPRRFEIGLSIIRARSLLLKPSAIPNSEDPGTMPQAIHRLIHHRSWWCRPIESWQPPRHTSRRVQFDALVRHLFAKYELPAFMPGIWLRNCRLERQVFQHLAKGLGIRQFGWPIRCTKPMVPHFMSAPADLTVTQALRWAQAFSLGADKPLARAIVNTVLRDRLPNDEFWNEAIRFLVHQSVGPAEATAIIDFLYRQRCISGTRAYGLIDFHRPLQPDFSVAGRSLHWLRQRMAYWRDEVETEPVHVPSVQCDTWQSIDIGHFQKPNADGKWTITEITSSAELRAEGLSMRHCVYSYLARCRRRLTSIWSLKQVSGQDDTRVLTIEVHNRSRSIVQVKGKRNRHPTGDEMSVVKTWAQAENLRVTL